MNPRKLYRVETGRFLAGVCGGVAEYVNLDPNVVRLIWCLLSIFSAGAGILLYIIAALILPPKRDVYPDT
jgi:phage shock protein C